MRQRYLTLSCSRWSAAGTLPCRCWSCFCSLGGVTAALSKHFSSAFCGGTTFRMWVEVVFLSQCCREQLVSRTEVQLGFALDPACSSTGFASFESYQEQQLIISGSGYARRAL